MSNRGKRFQYTVGFAESVRRRRVSKYMPHQNTRQRARYARQVAAGKLNMEISP